MAIHSEPRTKRHPGDHAYEINADRIVDGHAQYDAFCLVSIVSKIDGVGLVGYATASVATDWDTTDVGISERTRFKSDSIPDMERQFSAWAEVATAKIRTMLAVAQKAAE